MGSNLLPVWQEVQRYLKEGLSVMPIRDRDDEHGIAKTPFRGYAWKHLQNTIISSGQLFDDMDRLNTEAVAIIAGRVSGNLEVIDVDVKYNEGIHFKLFNDIKDLFPELLPLLRIHETPSGGFHILYRCTEPVDGNLELSLRPPTEDELLKKPKTKQYCFIETRGEGGYICAPPSIGYKVRQAVPIPTITSEQRQDLISLCRSYSTVISPESKPYTPSQQENSYYSVNPFEDYNNRVDPVVLAESLDWKVFKHNKNFIWFTRPGKTSGTSLSFNLSSRFFFCFTSSTELKPSHGYTPVNFLSVLKFNNDKKELHRYLTTNGYGQIKKEVEKKILKKALTNGGELPENLSVESRNIFEKEVEASGRIHPYGLFWFESEGGGTQIDREKLLTVCNKLGFCLYEDELYIKEGQILKAQKERDLFDTLKAYVKETDPIELNEIYNAWEAFIEAHGSFTCKRMPILGIDEVLHDDRQTCYKCYSNYVIKITSNLIDPLYYTSIKLFIKEASMLNREFIPLKDAEHSNFAYPSFLRLAIGSITEYLMNVIGFLSHEYKDETTGYIILLSEQCEDPRDGGGSGKNIFAALFKNVTTVSNKPGTGIKYDEKFLQSWSGQRILCINDVEKKFNFLFLKELSTGAGVQKKLFKDEKEVTVEMMPKFIVSTNYSIEITDGGLKRRVMPVEFTDFFTKSGGVDKHFNEKHFPNDWTAGDWSAYDSIIIKSVQGWLRSGLRLRAVELSTGGWQKQFEQTYGEIITGFLGEYFVGWVNGKELTNDVLKQQLLGFCNENNYTHVPVSKRLNDAITEYAKKEGVICRSGLVKRDGIKTVKYREFLVPETPF